MSHNQPMPRHCLVCLSGGLDSAVVATDLLREGHEVAAISVDYGQRHWRELDAAEQIAKALDITHHEFVDLVGVGRLLRRSALTDLTIDVPDGPHTGASQLATVVPNRNAILLAIAVGHAMSIGAGAVAIGAHRGDRATYPDCRPAFIDATNAQIEAAAGDGPRPLVIAPLLDMTKTSVVAHGASIHAPLALTYSCYRGGQDHCGACGACHERADAFTNAGIADPTTYAGR